MIPFLMRLRLRCRHFGDVFSGEVLSGAQGGPMTRRLSAIKVLKRTADATGVRDFVTEAALMAQFDHPSTA